MRNWGNMVFCVKMVVLGLFLALVSDSIWSFELSIPYSQYGCVV